MDETVAHVKFGRGGNSDGLVGVGWSAAEDGFRWMIGDVSEFWLDAPDTEAYVVTLDLQPHVGLSVRPSQRVIIKVEGIEVFRGELSQRGTFDVHIPPLERTSMGVLHVIIEHPDAITPKELAGREDDRRLALAIREARLSRLSRLQSHAGPATELAAAQVIVSPARLSTVFVGNCQMSALCSLYRRLLPPGADHDVAYIASYQDATQETRRIFAQATVLVQQVQNFVPRIGDLATNAKVYLVPHASCAFLWPYGGNPHPSNRPEPVIEKSGPYNAELGDSFLNRLISSGTRPSVAVARYLSAEAATVSRAERMMELHLKNQRERDEVCEIRVADRIESMFRTIQLFRSPNHPEPAMFSWIAREVFLRMREHPAAVARLIDSQPDLLPATETPIHPAVVEHFGLNYASPSRRYRYFEEGGFTFIEYAGRYMRYEWSTALAESLALLRQKPTDAAIAALEAALPRAPRSAVGRMALVEVLVRAGRLQDAADYAYQAVTIEPENSAMLKRLCQLSDSLLLQGPMSGVTPVSS